MTVIARVLLCAACVVGFVLVSTVVLVRGRLLDAETYTGALVRTDAYERTYTEVLADPELADLVEDLLGGLDIEGMEPVQKRAFTTSALRLVVPPATLQAGSETVIGEVLAYVRGDVSGLDTDVDVAAVLERVADSAEVWVRARLAAVGSRPTTSIDEYRSAVTAFVGRLAAGDVPDTLPVLGDASVDPGTIVEVLAAASGAGAADPMLRERIEAAVRGADQRDGLIEATAVAVEARADDAVGRLRAELDEGRHFDVVAALADKAGRPQAAVVDRLDSVRDAVRMFGPGTAVLGAVLMAGAVGGLAWLDRGNPRRLALLLSAAAVGAGGAVVLLWALVRRLVAAPLAPATSTGSGSWGLPGGLRALVADIQGSLADDLARSVLRLALVPVTAGVVLAAVVLLGARLRLPSSRGVAIGTGVAVLAGAVVWAVPARTSAGTIRACNGAHELCERGYDEVAYAATHNSMSSPDVVSIWPEHDGDIRTQLDGGIRALLIDTHHWSPLVSADQLAAAAPQLPPALAEQVFDTLGARREPRDGIYLCHNHCALGAIPFVDTLVTVREFLEDNPDDVVTLIIQDQVPPAETADAVAEAGLDRYLYRHDPSAGWPTLGELIDAGERLVVFAENEGPPPDWYHQAFELIQDTPFRFESPEELSCVAARGDPDADLFLMNHWITRLTPDRAVAAVVNQHDVIVERARRCQTERGLMPNFVAVDFFGIGDVVSAVASLNGLD